MMSIFSSSEPVFLVVKGTDELRGTVAGAPLRAFGTLAFIWIFARVIFWNCPADIGADLASLKTGKTASVAAARVRDVGPRYVPEIESLGSAAPGNRVDNNQSITSLSLIGPESIDSNVAGRSVFLCHPLLMTLQPEAVAYRLSPAISPERAGPPSRAIASNTPRAQNLATKQHGQGLGGYFWTFVRPSSQGNGAEGGRAGATISNGQYGGSQFGAILSHPVLTTASSDLAVYGRFSAALSPFEQEELALGLKIRPVRSLPLSVHAEQRLSADSGGNRGAALYVAGGSGPHQIVEEIVFETYAQAGYVLGKNESHFFDGSANLQRPIAQSGRKTISIGGGIWAGGQRKVTRLDVGPKAEFRVPVGTTSADIALDWRFRIAGEAQPGNGLAITVSTGF
jgi:hypothetical protein